MVSNCIYTSSVISFDLKQVFEPWTKTAADGPDSPFNWKYKAKMSKPRANFAHLVLDNLVYVFGGICGRGKEGSTLHIPSLASDKFLSERYNPAEDKWDQIEIAGANPLAAFGWTPLAKGSGEIMILGGTDGDMLQ